MKSLTCIPQDIDKSSKATLQHNYFWKTLTKTASALKHDHDIITIKSAKSLKLFWYGEVAGRCREINIC